MTWMLLMEGLVAALLIATIGFCWRLHRRLDELKGAREEMAKLIAELDRSSGRAAGAIAELRSASEGAGAALERKLAEARQLADDLHLMVDTGNRVADRLEGDIGAARRAPAGKETPAEPAAARTAAERDLVRVLRRVK